MSTKPISLEAIESILGSDPYDVELGRLARVFVPALIAEVREARWERDDARSSEVLTNVEFSERTKAAESKLAKVRELLDDPYADLNLETWSTLRKILEGDAA